MGAGRLRPRAPAQRRSARAALRAVLAGALVWLAAACSWTGASRPPLPSAPHPDIGGPAVAAVKRAGVLRVASDLSDPPLAFREQGRPAGYEMDLAELLAQALGVRLAVADTPRALVMPGFETADLLIGGWTADHAPGLPSRPYYIVRQALVWRGARTPSGALPLRGLRVAAAGGSAAASLAAGLGASPVLLTYRPDEALRAVARGAVDVAVCDEPLAVEYARTIRGLRTAPAAGDAVPLVVLAREDAPDLAAFASAVIEELARTNGLARLRQRWRL